MNKRWTAHGKVTNEDKLLIEVVAEKSEVAAQIFVTGAVREEELGTIASSVLYASNDVVAEPLFIQTREMLVVMDRFDPKEVWTSFDPKILEKLINDKQKRMGVKPFPVNDWDFYGSFFDDLKLRHGEFSIPCTEKQDLDSFYQITYAGCLWCFDKPGYMAVPVAQHFALAETEEWYKNDFNTRVLNEMEVREMQMLQGKYKNVQGITNDELDFILKLHKAGLKNGSGT